MTKLAAPSRDRHVCNLSQRTKISRTKVFIPPIEGSSRPANRMRAVLLINDDQPSPSPGWRTSLGDASRPARTAGLRCYTR